MEASSGQKYHYTYLRLPLRLEERWTILVWQLPELKYKRQIQCELSAWYDQIVIYHNTEAILQLYSGLRDYSSNYFLPRNWLHSVCGMNFYSTSDVVGSLIAWFTWLIEPINSFVDVNLGPGIRPLTNLYAAAHVASCSGNPLLN